MTKKRIMVDMTASLLHHGHIRLLQHAASLGEVIVALTSDEEVIKRKGYVPELTFSQRKEILESIRYVGEVVASPWLIDEDFLQQHNCDYLLHGTDNCNHISPDRLIIVDKTEGISSSELREKVLDCLVALNISSKNNSSSDTIARLLIETIKKEFRLE